MKLAAALLPFAMLAVPVDEPLQVGFATLAGFDYVEGMTLPKEVLKYDQQRVVVSGFMRAEDGSPADVDAFMLINDACGCTGTPMMNEIVFCFMPDGKTARIQPSTVKITGTLSVGEEKEDGVVVGIYVLDVEKIE